jgi:prepilin-type N-terminal cleavage/methylation domain-containing protein
MVLGNINRKQKDSGFTIVELLVVIVVIGILAAITIVSYSGITNRANTASGQSDASSILGKINAYVADTTYGTPTSYGSITNAGNAASYSAPLLVFTTISGSTPSAQKDMTAFRPAGIATDALDYYLCGTTGSATAVSTYGGATTGINVVSGIKIGYWDYTSGAGAENSTTYNFGTVSGTYGSPAYNVGCVKMGIAEAVVAVAKAVYSETGTYPTTSAQMNTANVANSAKLPVGVTTIRTGAPTTGNGTTTVEFECGTASAATLPCNNTGGRITYWDYSLGTPAAATITYGTATNFAVPAS